LGDVFTDLAASATAFSNRTFLLLGIRISAVGWEVQIQSDYTIPEPNRCVEIEEWATTSLHVILGQNLPFAAR
jgi:hypothetical protein